MKTFNVLPTDPRFIELTFEQREFIWENYLLDNPDIEKKLKNRFDDPEFDEIWDSLDETSQNPSSDVSNENEGDSISSEFEDIEESYRAFTEGDNELPDYKAVLKAKGIVLDNENVSNVEDWEEVEE